MTQWLSVRQSFDNFTDSLTFGTFGTTFVLVFSVRWSGRFLLLQVLLVGTYISL